MRHLLGLIAMLCIAVSPARAGIDADQEVTPAVAKVVEFAKSAGMKTLVYFELDDARPGDPMLTLDISGQLPGTATVITYRGTRGHEFMVAFADEAQASGPAGWRRIVIVIDKELVSVERSQSPGPLEGRRARICAEIDRVFPGHDPIPCSA